MKLLLESCTVACFRAMGERFYPHHFPQCAWEAANSYARRLGGSLAKLSPRLAD